MPVRCNAERLSSVQAGAYYLHGMDRDALFEAADALLAALHSGRIRAAVDVTDPEPLTDGHPLWSAPNVLITPHVGGSSPNFMRRAMQLAGEQIRRMQLGEELINIVTGEY